jgi:hypothetical protein
MDFLQSLVVDVGECIYCGAREGVLSDEHVVPYALKGTWILKHASCESCRKITSLFERRVLRGPYLLARTVLKLPTRHKKQRPKTFTVETKKGDAVVTHELGTGQFPATVFFLQFAPPACTSQASSQSGINCSGAYLYQLSGPTLDEFAKQNLADAVLVRHEIKPVDFARMIAKIAYGFCVFKYGSVLREKSFVLPAILGQENDIGRWVGCDGERHLSSSNTLHVVETAENNGLILARVKLFSFLDSPEYLVVVGRL